MPAASVPVLRPRLPPVELLLPYLRRIDETRIYSNWGPLNDELEHRLALHFGVPGAALVSAGSGTVALFAAVLAAAGRARAERPLAVVPAFTFVATAAAVEQCGFEVRLADVDAETWALDPQAVLGMPDLDRVGVVVPVAPFGRPVRQQPWLDFRERTGIPVAIDGAATFELLPTSKEFAGELPVAVSFHATKSFSTGEGGCVISLDPDCRDRAARALNFGFHELRDSTMPSTNGKLSEYHAAVGLAGLDAWPQRSAELEDVAESYRRTCAAAGIEGRLYTVPEIGSNYVLFRCADAEHARRVQDGLAEHEVDYRLWYGRGLHRQSYLLEATGSFPVTDVLAPNLLGLPMAPDLSHSDIETIAAGLAAGTAHG